MTPHRFGILFLLCIGMHVDAQSPWVRTQAGAYGQVGLQWIPSYREVFDESGKTSTLERQLSEATFQLYGEYGIGKKTTGIISIPLRYLALSENPNYKGVPSLPASNLLAAGNISVGLRHQLKGGNWPLALSLRVDLPSWKTKENSGLRGGYAGISLLPMLSIGHGAEQWYFYSYTGIGLRSNAYSYTSVTGIEGGRHLGRWWVIAYSEALRSLKNGNRKDQSAFNRTVLFVNNQAYWSVGMKTLYKANRFWGLLAGVAGVAEARLLPRSPQIMLGAYFNWD